MPIISVEIMKTIDERELQKATKEKQTKTERSKGNRSFLVLSRKIINIFWCCLYAHGYIGFVI